MTNEEMMRRMKSAQQMDHTGYDTDTYDAYLNQTSDQRIEEKAKSTYSTYISGHFESHFPSSRAFAFVEKDEKLHIDVCVLEPTKNSPFYVLYTCGMSDYAMRVPPRFSDMRRAELFMLLPPEWRFAEERGEVPYQYFWPVKLLRALGRFPHESGTWLGRGHSIANGNDMMPFVRDSAMCAAVLCEKKDGFSPLAVRDDFSIHLYQAIPIYKEELDFKEKYGVNELYKLFAQNRTSLITDLHRENVALPYINA